MVNFGFDNVNSKSPPPHPAVGLRSASPSRDSPRGCPYVSRVIFAAEILAVYCGHHVVGIALACGYIRREDFVDSREIFLAEIYI